MSKIKIKDESGDRKYFTIIPNYILNHSTAIDQALYLQMKRLVGDKEGICYASEKYFKDKLGIGSKSLKKSLTYLIEHKWIESSGYKFVKTNGGNQKIKTYLVKDIWQLNADYYYKGVSERELLNNKGVSESSQRGVQKEQKGVAFEQQRRTYKKNNEEEHNTATTSQSIHPLVEFFYSLKGWNMPKTSVERKASQRHYASAKDFLSLCGNDLELAKERLMRVKNWAESYELSWLLSTAVKKWHEIPFLKTKQEIEEEKQRSVIRYDFRTKK